MPDDEKESESKENAAPKLSVSKKVILRDLGAEKEDISEIRTNSEADELIEYLKKKNTQNDKEEDDEPKMRLKANVGHPISPLPEANITSDEAPRGFMPKLNALHPENARPNRRNKDARVLVLFNDEFPDGRFI